MKAEVVKSERRVTHRKGPTRGVEGTESKAQGRLREQQEKRLASEVGVGARKGGTQMTMKLNRAGRATRGPGIAFPSIQLLTALLCDLFSLQPQG